ncbi:hypothetical protein ABZ921_01910 [Streptomyces atriruber]|uniref:Uncharacterized protein n=1 Tax=Streptomyces atriruber TaxID=545121 RepID=A0ABV3BF21_9ACTN
MSFGLILAIIMAVVFVALGLADQRKIWRRIRARWAPNSEALEPSDTVVTGLRVLFFAWAALLLFAGCQAQEAKDRTDRIEQEVDSPYGS